MTQFHSVAPTAEKSTRDCLDPWFFAMLNARRELQPCCWHPAVGTLPVGGSLNDVLEGAAMRELRRQLLTGELNEYCRRCPARPLTDPDRLRNHLLGELAEERLSGNEPSLDFDRRTGRRLAIASRQWQRGLARFHDMRRRLSVLLSRSTAKRADF
jgi:hypothetical protein